MRTGRPKAELVVTDVERTQLTAFASSRSLPASLSARAHIVLSSADGEANSAIAKRMKLTNVTVGKWRSRFIERRIASLYDDVRPGPPRQLHYKACAEHIASSIGRQMAPGLAAAEALCTAVLDQLAAAAPR